MVGQLCGWWIATDESYDTIASSDSCSGCDWPSEKTASV